MRMNAGGFYEHVSVLPVLIRERAAQPPGERPLQAINGWPNFASGVMHWSTIFQTLSSALESQK